QQRDAPGVDEVEQARLAPVEVDAADGDGDALGPRRLVRGAHDLVARVLAGAEEEARGEGPAADAQRLVGGGGGAVGGRGVGGRGGGPRRRGSSAARGKSRSPHPPPTRVTISSRSPAASTRSHCARGSSARLSSTATRSPATRSSTSRSSRTVAPARTARR